MIVVSFIVSQCDIFLFQFWFVDLLRYGPALWKEVGDDAVNDEIIYPIR